VSARSLQEASSPWNQDHADQGTIHALPRQVLGGPVVFASSEARPGAGPSLALMLLRALALLESHRHAPPEEKTLTLHKSTLGRPSLFLGEEEGPSLSFSHGKGRLWAAMCDQGSVGIDVACPEEFAVGYPFARAFRPEELDWAKALCHNDMARGAALVWSVKEAAVKATGIGFNLFDPLEVRVGTPLFSEQGMVLEVSAGRPIPAWVGPEDTGWLSVALL
jgi:phosphopantetheinyl transferase